MAVELVLGGILASTFAAVGVLTTMIATRLVHWFPRTLLMLGVLSPLLLGSAVEPFATLLLEAAVVALATVVGARLSQSPRTRNGDGPKLTDAGAIEPQASDIRFSLLGLLLATGLAAILLGVAASMPELNANAWISITSIGMGAGVCTILGLLAWQRIMGWYCRLPIALVGSLLVGMALAWVDWFVPSVVGWAGWPPDDIGGAGFLGIGNEERPIMLWIFVCPAITFLVAAWFHVRGQPRVGILNRFRGSPFEYSRRNRGWRGTASLASVTGLIFAAPTCVLWELVMPPTPPKINELRHNAYVEVLRLATDVNESQDIEVLGDFDEISRDELFAAIAHVNAALDETRLILRLPSRVPVDCMSGDIGVENLQRLRNLARAIAAKGRLAVLDGDHDEATESYLDAVRLGFFVRRGGLLVDALVGMGCSGSGIRGIYEIREEVSQEKRRYAISELLSLIDEAEEYEGFKQRDVIWERNALGWHGRFRELVFRVAGESLFVSEESIRQQFQVEQTIVRLLARELAVHGYHRDHQNWPVSLAELVPDYLPAVPADPFAERDRVMQYKQLNDSVRIYSVGANGIDDGGDPPEFQEGFLFLGAPGTGDLILQSHFANEGIGDDDAGAAD